MCREDHNVRMNGKVTKIFLNCNAIRENVSDKVKDLLDYIAGRSEGHFELTQKIDSAVRQVNEDHEWRKWAVTFEEKLREAREDGCAEGLEKGLEKGREEGLEKGREEGLEKGREEGLEKGREAERKEHLFAMFTLNFDNNTIARIISGLTDEQIDAYREEWKKLQR